MNESQQTQSTVPHDDEIDLRELFRVLWAGKWLIGGITFAATVIAVIVALMLPNIYRAEALLAPNDQGSAGGLSALAAQYGGLASLAGINIGSGSTDKTAIGLEILKSRKFISAFIERHDILVPLMAVKGWDEATGELIIDPDDYDVATKKWVRDVGPPKKTVPSLQEAYQEFMDNLSISQDKVSGFITISFEYYSPSLAKKWVDSLIADLNSVVMRQDVSEAEQSIEFLSEQAQRTSLTGLQDMFFGLIEERMKTVVLAKVTDEYLFKTVDPAVVPEEKVGPNRSMIVAAAALLALFLSTLYSLYQGMRRGRNSSTELPDPNETTTAQEH